MFKEDPRTKIFAGSLDVFSFPVSLLVKEHCLTFTEKIKIWLKGKSERQSRWISDR
ncbi:unnamed protein product [Larinioides sclopetarius]|uniref:Uncharacterized protein n=1 Tax=Larinioides sclopetarius TaxID=280406 RepID=A0AAV2A9P8_9ARAC